MELQSLATYGLANGFSSRSSLPGPTDWKPLRYFNLYRTTLAGLFVVLTFAGGATPLVGNADHGLFTATAVLYLAFAALSQFTIHWQRPALDFQVSFQVAADVVALSLMMHASGGITSGFAILLVVAIAGGSILTEGRIAVLFAAMASLAVLVEQIVAAVYQVFPETHYGEAGMLGMAFFATALFIYLLARRIRASEALAVRWGIDLANLAQLNEHIIERMQSGILVVDTEHSVRLMNDSARALLGLKAKVTDQSLAASTPELVRFLSRWRDGDAKPSHLFRPSGAEVEVMASFAPLGQEGAAGTLIFLEDATAMRQRAQRLKLASLGRLTASIAHEIRNPLGAISHAGQLLAECPPLAPATGRLVGIIQDNCRRVNAIVENVLQVSRRKPSVPEKMQLKPWLAEFLCEFTAAGAIAAEQLSSSVVPEGLQIRFDPSQLHQVLWNLCENAVRHGGNDPRLVLRAGVATETGRPYVDVADSGPGISGDDAEAIFEPFYTTAAKGTGLGLYIARELCEANQASLNLLPCNGAGACFRITFSDPRRREAPF